MLWSMITTVYGGLTRITWSRWLRLHETLHACTAYSFERHDRVSLQKRKQKGDDVDDEISRRRLDGFVIRLSARSSVSTPVHHRIRAFLASILASSHSLLSRAKRTNFPSQFHRFPSSLPALLSLFLHRERTYLPRQRLHPTE